MRSAGTVSRGSISRITAPAAGGFLSLLVIVALAAVPARAEIMRTATSVTFSGAATGTAGPVSASATLWIDGGFLNLLLQNTSTAATAAQGDLLTSFYFGVSSATTSGSAPTLTYASAAGQAYRFVASGVDQFGVWQPPSVVGGTGLWLSGSTGLSNLMATGTGDLTWQFKSGLSLAMSEPPLNFGIGTVGNTNLGSTNGFKPQIVGKTDFGIASTAAEPSGTVDKAGYYVSGSALFRFGNIGSYTISQIPDHAVFGFGSDPDFTIGVPEPAGIALATVGGIVALGLGGRRRAGWPRAFLESTAAAVVAGIVVVALLFAAPAPAAPGAPAATVDAADDDGVHGATGGTTATCAASSRPGLPPAHRGANGWSCRDAPEGL